MCKPRDGLATNFSFRSVRGTTASIKFRCFSNRELEDHQRLVVESRPVSIETYMQGRPQAYI